MFNKEINKIKIAVTNKCNLSCPYCFVKKGKQVMAFDTAIKSVDLLINSKGQDKLLSIYGGEPFLNFALIEKIVPYAKIKATKKKKNITISICTNATLLDNSKVNFLKNNGVKLIVSLVGQSKDHDSYRVYNKKSGTYNQVSENVNLIHKKLPKDNISVSYCVFPSLMGKLEDNFKHIHKMGFSHFNFEIIRDFEAWDDAGIMNFAAAFNNIVDSVIAGIKKNKFIFLNPINWQIKYGLLDKSLACSCPFNYKLEVYPQGEVAFSPFLLNLKRKNRFVIGNVNGNFSKLSSCEFNQSSNRCLTCENDYFKGYAGDDMASKAYKIYQLICLNAANKIIQFSQSDRMFLKYTDIIKKRICF